MGGVSQKINNSAWDTFADAHKPSGNITYIILEAYMLRWPYDSGGEVGLETLNPELSTCGRCLKLGLDEVTEGKGHKPKPWETPTFRVLGRGIRTREGEKDWGRGGLPDQRGGSFKEGALAVLCLRGQGLQDET